jgi:hypothetical protein
MSQKSRNANGTNCAGLYMSCRRMAFEGMLVKPSSAMWASSSQLNESYTKFVPQLAVQIRSHACKQAIWMKLMGRLLDPLTYKDLGPIAGKPEVIRRKLSCDKSPMHSSTEIRNVKSASRKQLATAFLSSPSTPKNFITNPQSATSISPQM